MSISHMRGKNTNSHCAIAVMAREERFTHIAPTSLYMSHSANVIPPVLFSLLRVGFNNVFSMVGRCNV